MQVALDLLRRIEADTQACIEARKRLSELRRVVLSAVLKIAQHAVDELLAPAWGGVIAGMM